jgi:head-tail adaptor
MVAIGAKRERVRLVRRTRVQDENGNYVVSEATLANRWAKVTPINGNENELAGQLRAVMTFRIDLDIWGVGVTSDDKLMWQTRGEEIELNIHEIRLPSVRALDTVLIVASGTPDGTVP